ncbi:MAG: SEC-C domain-containing protein [Clostridia bacterium]|nr:SEC-C domain-containing protein [Clostridia bacterium]
MFDAMSADIQATALRRVLGAVPRSEAPIVRKQVAKPLIEGFAGGKMPQKKVPVRKTEKVGRNDPCPCGSGKKYKKCCGAGDNSSED